MERSDIGDEAAHDVELLWDFHILDSGEVKADVLLVLGSHDLRVADRAAELYLAERAAPCVIISGGHGKVTKSIWARAEALVFAERLIRHGVPSGAMLLESEARDLGENFRFSRDLALGLSMTPLSGIVVCKPYVCRRAFATAQVRWPEVAWKFRPPVMTVWEAPTEAVPLREMICLIVGNTQRLRVYADRGHAAETLIPANVLSGYERLVRQGFIDSLIDS